MWRFALIIRLALALAIVPGAATACAYPTPLRMLNQTMIEAIKRGGDVTMHTRGRLGKMLDQMSPDALLAALSSEVSRRNLRAARNVVGVASALADGRGLRIDPELSVHTSQLKEAVQADCSDASQGVTGTAQATGVEHGGVRKEGGPGRGLTFQEGIVRLSVAFTIYLVFLVFLFVLRQTLNARYPTVVEPAPVSTADGPEPRPPPTPASPP